MSSANGTRLVRCTLARVGWDERKESPVSLTLILATALAPHGFGGPPLRDSSEVAPQPLPAARPVVPLPIYATRPESGGFWLTGGSSIRFCPSSALRQIRSAEKLDTVVSDSGNPVLA